MKRTLLIFNIIFIMLFSFGLIQKSDNTYFADKFYLNGIPGNTFLDQLGFSKLDYSDFPQINTVNMVSEKVLLNGISVDTEAVYYSMYTMPIYLLFQKIDYYVSQATQNEYFEDMNKLLDLKGFLQRNPLTNKATIMEYLRYNHQYDYNAEFFIDILQIKNSDFIFDLDNPRNINKAVEVIYFEDFDLSHTISAVYTTDDVYKVETYYLKSEDCSEFNFLKKLNEEELTLFLDELDPSIIVRFGECHLQTFEKEDFTEVTIIQEIQSFTHNKVFSFYYQSSETKPIIKTTIVFDFWNFEKMLLTTETASFKITKEAHYNRNRYNQEFISNDYIHEYVQVDELYPTETYPSEAELWLYSSQNYFHQLGIGNEKNIKYLKVLDYYDAYYKKVERGTLELIYDELGNVVHEDLVAFSFNFGTNDLYHYVKDVFPYLVWGNTAFDRDMHSEYERFIWDKDRFTPIKGGQKISGFRLIKYYESGIFIQRVGMKIPNEIKTNEIDNYYNESK